MTDSRAAALDVSHLSVRAGERLLVDDLTFRIGAGERVGLIGESGSGKSLTSLAVMGLLPDTVTATGSVRVGEDAGEVVGLGERAAARLRGSTMAMVFQEPMTALNPLMRVGTQIAEAMRIHRTQPDRRSAARRAVELLADVGLPSPEEAARAYPHQLSGGQRQRVVLAIALANDPALLVADEPTTALDVTVQRQVLDLVLRSVTERGTGLLFITHDLAVVGETCDRVLVMNAGVIVEEGPIDRVFTKPEHPYTRGLLAASDLDATDSAGRLFTVATSEGYTPGLSVDRMDAGREERASAPEAPTVVRASGLTKTYTRGRTSLFSPPQKVEALRGLDFEIRAGDRFGIVGESGSGKSVTARTILGLLPDTAVTDGAVLLSDRTGQGAVDVLSISADELRRARGRDVAMVFQEPSTALNPVHTVGWQIVEGLRAHGRVSRKEGRAKAIDILRRVGIPDPETRVDHYPHQFSGGQKQRVVIAMALVLDPGLIVADEPTTALDVTVQAEILDLLRRCRDEFGAAVILITHNMGVVADLADRVAVMYRSRLVEQADVATLFASPREEYTRNLLASVPKLGEGVAATEERAAVRTRAREASATETAPVVVAEGLEIEYPGRLGSPAFRAVKGVDLRIEAGEVLGLVGESGSGKTTIGRAIAGLTSVTGGSLRVLGTEMLGVRERDFRKRRADIGFVFQDPATSFNPRLTIAECVAEPLIVHGRAKTPQAARGRVDELLEAVQLPKAFGDRYPHELSGGQRQRASLARGLALEPSLLVADEPTSALDVSVQARVLELFAELQRELGFAALFISHDLAVVDLLADRIAVLYRGELVEEGTGAEVLGNPQHPYTQRLLASLPVPDPAEQAERRARLHALRAAERADG